MYKVYRKYKKNGFQNTLKMAKMCSLRGTVCTLSDQGSSGFRTVGPVSSTYPQQHFDQDPGLACKNDHKTIIAIPFVKEFKDKYKDTRRIVTAMQFLGLSLNLL